jgi:2'-5' RNA ligase
MNNKILKLSKVLFGMGLKKEASDLESLSEGSDLAGEPAGKTEFSGILKLMPANPPTDLQGSLSDYFQEHNLLPIPADRLHITLLHQDVLKQFAKELKNKPIPQYTGSITYGPVYSIKRSDEKGDKESVYVKINEQDALRTHVEEVLESLGLDKNLREKNRIYHISLANKTGTTDKSVGHTEAFPMTIEESTPI